MKEIVGDLFQQECDAICITTNGFVKKNGELVMGRGCAFQAKQRWSAIPKTWGAAIKKYGNHVYTSGVTEPYQVLSFPVKHNWYEDADIELIKASCQELMRAIEKFGWKKVILPRPGCGNGKLKWEDVRKEISELLDDRVYVIHFE